MAIIKPGHEEEVGSAREDADKEGGEEEEEEGGDLEQGGLLFQVCLVCTHPGRPATGRREEMQATSSK